MATDCLAAIRKSCTRCGASKPATSEYFHLAAKGKFGLSGKCKPCQNAAIAAAKVAHPETVRRDYAARRLVMQGRAKERRKINIAAARKYEAAYRDANRSKAREYAAQWRLDNLEHARRAKRASESKRRAIVVNAGGRFTAHDILKMVSAQGGKCWWCGGPLGRHHADHRIPLAKGGSNDKSNIVLACAPCNIRKSTKMPWELDNPRLL